MIFHGLFGKTLSHSISPELHKEIYKVTGYDAAYKIMEFQNDELENAVNALKILKIKGVNVTIPYKEKVLPFLDFIDVDVKNIGAVNTISLKSEKLYGYNTDCYGFGKMIEDFKVLGKDVTVLGYGGASKSVIYHLLKANINSITIVSRKAFELKKSITKYCFFLLVNLHLVKVGNFSFYGFDCFRLIDAFDMQVYDHSRFQIQKVRQDAVV